MKRVLPIIIVILLIIGVGGGVVWSILAGRYKPESEYVIRNREYFEKISVRG